IIRPFSSLPESSSNRVPIETFVARFPVGADGPPLYRRSGVFLTTDRRMDEVATAVTIREFAPGDGDRWDSFVEAAPGATFFHLSGWREVIERAFRHRTFYLIAERHGAITGVLPLTLVRTKLFGATLISNAFCVEGGPVAADPATLKALERSAVSLTRELRVP